MLTFPTYDTVDLFAGPGGWSVAARRLGLREMGIEFDKAVHQTRRAAGFHTIRDDVRKWSPGNFPNARGLIASPPCQTFSAAGKGAGRRALDVVLREVGTMHQRHTEGLDVGTQTVQWEDERTGLVLEPLRWALDAIRFGQPYEWLAFEQVPTVLPVWQAIADVLRTEGYSVAVGNLQAEQYGVPQTRKRAVLIARWEGGPHYLWPWGPVRLPTPTHSRYHTRDKARLDPDVLPWVSMGKALQLTVGHHLVSPMNPDRTVMRRTSDPAPTIAGGKSAPWSLIPSSEVPTEPGPDFWRRARGRRWFAGAGQTAVDTASQARRPDTHPAHTITGKGTAAWTDENSRSGGVRVTVEECSLLQSFPPDFPWRGSSTEQYQQVGNAIPPLLAEAVLRQVV